MQVKMNKGAREDFENLDSSLQVAFLEVKKNLKAWPELSGAKRLSGRWHPFSRVKLAEDWRVIYLILPNEVNPTHLTVVRIRHRSVVYK